MMLAKMESNVANQPSSSIVKFANLVGDSGIHNDYTHQSF